MLPAVLAVRNNHRKSAAGAVQQEQVIAGPIQWHNQQLAAEDTAHKLVGGLVDTAVVALDTGEPADNHKVGGQ